MIMHISVALMLLAAVWGIVAAVAYLFFVHDTLGGTIALMLSAGSALCGYSLLMEGTE